MTVVTSSLGRGACRPVAALVLVLVGVLCSTGVANAAREGVLTVDPGQKTSGKKAPPKQEDPPAFFNRPTMPLDKYKEEKRGASGGTRPGGAPRAPTNPLIISNPGGFNGITQATAESTWPPDINGAVSPSQVAEVVNQHLTVFTKSGTQISDRSLASLTGSSGLFDPRILYDQLWKRWVISVERGPDSPTSQSEFLLISTTSNAAGSYVVYNLNVNGLCGTDTFWDYPQIGLQQDAVVLTGNCFQGNNFLGARTIGMAKALIYNSLGFSVPILSVPASDGTLTPTNVIDQSNRMHMLTTSVHNVTFQDPGNAFYGNVVGNVPISGFFTPSVPRAAGQKGCTVATCQLDTGDGRFQAPGTQYGDNLWNVATYGLSGGGSFATPSWGQFDVEGTGVNTTKMAGRTFQTSCSDDFNASLAALSNNSMWITYTSTNPEGSACGGTFVRQVAGGRVNGNGFGTTQTTVPFTSAATLTGNFDPNFGTQRWGDTSSVSTDPSDATIAWQWNESVANSSNWGTRVQQVRNVP